MIHVRPLTRDELGCRLDEVAALRIAVFRDWPYLYDGDLAYEREYLRPYLHSPAAMITGALHNDRLVGISTAMPMEDQSANFTAPLAAAGVDPKTVFYGGESVLLPLYRGRGIGGRFYDLREARAAQLGRRTVAFCAVVRPEDHPMRPANARGNERFWTRRGYAPAQGLMAELDWRDRGEATDTPHLLQFWTRDLP